MKITVPISVGELLDRISILEIKSMFTDNKYVRKELVELNQIKDTLTQYTLEYEIKLKKVNEKLWKTEDKIRQKETLKEFDDEFIKLARSVYTLNDERFLIKKEINDLTNSFCKEIKIFNKYP
jgi:predicted  nucleic acid-binding Zn-ribbon protein